MLRSSAPFCAFAGRMPRTCRGVLHTPALAGGCKIRILCGCIFNGERFPWVTLRSPTAKSHRHSASGVASFGRLSVAYCIRPIGWRGHAKHVMPRRKSRHLARGKRSATPGIHHPPPSCVRRGRELHIIPGITAQYGRMALNANYLNLQPLCGCGHW